MPTLSERIQSIKSQNQQGTSPPGGGVTELLRDVRKTIMPESVADVPKQGVAGILDLVTSPPEAEGLEALVPGAVREVMELGNTGYELATGDQINQTFERNRELLHDTLEQSNELMGVDRPEDTTEAVARYGSGALIPVGGIPALNRATTLGGKVAEQAVRFGIPFNQGATGTQFATEAAVAGALSGGITEALGATGTVPQSQVDTFLEPQQASAQEPQQDSTSLSDRINSLDLGDSGGQSIADRIQAINEERLNQQAKEEADYTTEIAVGAASLFSFIVGRSLWNYRKARKAAEARAPEEPPNVLTSGEEAFARGVDSIEGVIAPVRRAGSMSDEELEEFITEARLRGNPVAAKTRADSTIETGRWAGRVFDDDAGGEELKLSVAPQQFFGEVRRSDRSTEIDELVRARDELDTRQFAAQREAGTDEAVDIDDLRTVRTQFTDMDNKNLRDRITQLESDPEVRRYADQYSNLGRDVADYLKARGYIGSGDYNEMIKAHPNFMPRMFFRKPKGPIERLLGPIEADETVSEFEDSLLRHRRFEDITSDEPVFRDPLESMDAYIRSAQRTADLNDLRRKALSRGGFKRVGDNETVDATTDVPVRVPMGDKSSTIHYRVHDPFYRHLLKFRAPIQNSLMNASRRTFQAFTTGTGQPFFAPISLMYEAHLVPRTVRKGSGRQVGFLPSQIADKVPDLTAVPLALQGVGRGLYGSALRGARQVLDESEPANNALRRVFGNDGAEAMKEKVSRAFLNSTLHAVSRAGGVAGRFTIDADQISAAGEYARMTGKTPAARQALNGYRALLDSVQNGARLEYFARNFREGMSAQDIENLARETRDLTADFSRAGAGNAAMQERSLGMRMLGSAQSFGAQNIPYGNVAIQSMVRYARMFKENPQLFATAMATTTIMPLVTSWFRAQSMGEEYVDHYWNELSWQDRLLNIYWYKEGKPPQEAVKVRLLPEDAVVAGTAMAIWDGVMGWSTGDWRNDPDAGFREFMEKATDADASKVLHRTLEGAAAGASRIANPGIPPLLQAGFGAAGQRLDVDVGRGLQGRVPFRMKNIYENHVPEGDEFGDLVHSKKFEAIIRAILGTSGNMMVQAAQEAERAHEGTGGNWDKTISEGAEKVFDIGPSALPGSHSMFGVPAVRNVWGERAKKLQDKENAIKRIRETAQIVRGNKEVSSLDRPTQLMTGAAGGASPTNEQIGAEVEAFWNSTSDIRAQIDTQWDVLNSVDQRTDLPYSRKPDVRNRAIKRMDDLRELWLMEITEFESQIAQQYGMDSFSLEDFTVR